MVRHTPPNGRSFSGADGADIMLKQLDRVEFRRKPPSYLAPLAHKPRRLSFDTPALEALQLQIASKREVTEKALGEIEPDRVHQSLPPQLRSRRSILTDKSLLG